MIFQHSDTLCFVYSASGSILVTNTDTLAVIGYISPILNDLGQYGFVQASVTGSLTVSFSYQPLDPTPIDITATNGVVAGEPFFGGSEFFFFCL